MTSALIRQLTAGRNCISSLSNICVRTISDAPRSGSKPLEYDLVVVGGGIVGCATARQIKISNPNLKIAIIEKEDRLAPHQSGHNSGVLHAGIYYKPGSLKAKLCVRGIDLAYKFFDSHNVPYKKVGKLIVAVDETEISNLDDLFKRAQLNNCKQISMISGDKIKDYASFCKGMKAIWSPYTGIVDWGYVTKAYADDFEKRGGIVYTNYLLKNVTLMGESAETGKSNDYPVLIESEPALAHIRSKYMITCCGLQSDRVAKLSGCSSVPKIVPFRGEYLLLTSDKKNLVTTNVYPVPDPRLPFLGVHFTPRMNGDVWLGPNAVLACKREGYGYTQVSMTDLMESLSFSGMHVLMRKYMFFGLKEVYRGIWIRAQVKQLQRYMKDLNISDVKRGPSGVRAQALDAEGNLVDDFVFDVGRGELAQRVLHVRNAPSPGATSSLAIAEMVGEKAAGVFAGIK